MSSASDFLPVVVVAETRPSSDHDRAAIRTHLDSLASTINALSELVDVGVWHCDAIEIDLKLTGFR